MDRDRERRFGDRDRPPARGGSFRPGQRRDRSPPRQDSFRSNRDQAPRGRSPQPPVDTYIPSASNRSNQQPGRDRSPGLFRRRSRSPISRRDRSPPPSDGAWRPRDSRRWSPRRELIGRAERPRSPPRRRMRSRSPIAVPRALSPRMMRARSPLAQKRVREPSPVLGRGARSPPPAKRERHASPTRGRFASGTSPHRRPASPHYQYPGQSHHMARPANNWRRRSRSPARHEEYPINQASNTWRRRSPSPQSRLIKPEHHHQHLSEPTTVRESPAESRRSSPPIHPSRLALQIRTAPIESHSPASWSRNEQYSARSPPAHHSATRSPYRARSPLAISPTHDRAGSPSRFHERSPLLEPAEHHPISRQEYARNDSPYESPSHHIPGHSPVLAREDSPQPQLQAYSPGPARDQHSRRHETDEYHIDVSNISREHGPLAHYRDRDRDMERDRDRERDSYRGFSSRGRSNGRYRSRIYPSHGRMSPPSGPSTAPMSMSAHNRVSHPDSSGPVYSRAGPSNGSYPSRERQFSQSSAGRGRRYSESYTNPNDVPTGPRGSNNGPTYPAPFRGSSNNSTSTTYPRTQRFSTHLASLPAIVPGGKLLPSSIDRSVQEKLAKLEAEQKKLEQDLAEKIAKKRQGLRTWDKLSRESSRENLRGDLAEQQARSIVGDAGSSGPAF